MIFFHDLLRYAVFDESHFGLRNSEETLEFSF